VKTFIMTVDPHRKFSTATPEQILNACGVVSQWAMNPRYEEASMYEALAEQYQRRPEPMSAEWGGIISEDGVFSFPGDPDQFPLLTIQHGDEMLYQYQYSMVAVVNDGGTKIFRMD